MKFESLNRTFGCCRHLLVQAGDLFEAGFRIASSSG
jgi:hypothetical protein